MVGSGFGSGGCHPAARLLATSKGVELSDREFRAWLELLDYCEGYGSPAVPAGIARAVPQASRAGLRGLLRAGLLEEDIEVGGWRVHNWELYNGGASIAEKVSIVLASSPNIGAKELARRIVGRRDEVLKQWRLQRAELGIGSSSGGERFRGQFRGICGGGSREPGAAVPPVPASRARATFPSRSRESNSGAAASDMPPAEAPPPGGRSAGGARV
jgi:hypothetical protein